MFFYCTKVELKFMKNEFRMTWEWVNNDRTVICGLTIPLNRKKVRILANTGHSFGEMLYFSYKSVIKWKMCLEWHEDDGMMDSIME